MVTTNFFLGNSILNSAFIAWLIAQGIKVITTAFKGDFDLSRLTGAGGMPSSHSSTMLALTTSTLINCGYGSAEFSIALVLSAIVMYDATGVRRAAGEQAKILNYMMTHMKKMKPKTLKKDLKELLGHTPLEVIVGAILGIIVGLFVSRL